MEETGTKPKPLVEAGSHPLIWHIMKNYSLHGVNEFIVLGGYRCQQIKEYFLNYWLNESDVEIDLSSQEYKIIHKRDLSWKVSVVDTGLETGTAGRIRAVSKLIDSKFLLTYGDGVGNIDIAALVEEHRQNQKLVTVTAVQPSGRFGALNLSENNQVNSFLEKPKGDGSWINGGFFVCQPEVFQYLDSDSTIWEREPMERIAAEGQLQAFKHVGFWKPMDTLRDKQELEQAWESGIAPWKTW
jgi:glucose-1-phosphate cytidylyltransferase